MRPYLILVSAVVMQMCLGATYSWTVYVQPIRELTGLLQGPVQAPFTFFYFVFPGTMMLSGTLLPFLGPRRCAMFGGILFGSGWMLASLGDLYFGFTVLTGFNYGGVLVVYVSSAARSWGKEHVGQVYGWLFSANIPASVSPILAGMVYDAAGDFTPALWVIGGLLIVAAGVVFVKARILNEAGVG